MKTKFELHIYWSGGAGRILRGDTKKECLRQAAAFSYYRRRWYKNGQFQKEEHVDSL